MARRSEVMSVGGNETVIGAGVKIKGTLISDADITIDGKLEGDLKAVGNLSVGVNGLIKADISATNVHVAGQVRGNIEASGETVIMASGKVQGNITTGAIGIETGAVFVGKVTMVKTEMSLADEEAPEESLKDGGQS
jgi:cytoskeletal protein CcmA (bactofilin family)